MLTAVIAISFFGCNNILIFFIIFELVIFPVYLMVFLFGSQPEKIGSIYYAIIYTGGLSLPFLYEIINIESIIVRYYCRPFQQVIIIGLFLRKRPIYILHV